MPEIRVLQQQRENNIQVERKAYDARPPSACVNWLHLPYELWLDILVNYGVSARDLVNLEYTCKWFNCWGGTYYYALDISADMQSSYLHAHCTTDGSVTEEAARLVLKRYSKKRYGELVNRGKNPTINNGILVLNYSLLKNFTQFLEHRGKRSFTYLKGLSHGDPHSLLVPIKT